MEGEKIRATALHLAAEAKASEGKTRVVCGREAGPEAIGSLARGVAKTRGVFAKRGAVEFGG
jgi:hypothetical protein